MVKLLVSSVPLSCTVCTHRERPPSLPKSSTSSPRDRRGIWRSKDCYERRTRLRDSLETSRVASWSGVKSVRRIRSTERSGSFRWTVCSRRRSVFHTLVFRRALTCHRVDRVLESSLASRPIRLTITSLPSIFSRNTNTTKSIPNGSLLLLFLFSLLPLTEISPLPLSSRK